MKRKIIAFLSVSIIVTVISLIIISSQNQKMQITFKESTKGLAIMVYDEATSTYIKQNSVPKGEYHINEDKTHCISTGEIGFYDYENGTLTYNLSASDECYVFFDKGLYTPIVAKGTNLAEGIISLAGRMNYDNSWGIIDENGYRYEGGGYRITDTYEDQYADLTELISYDGAEYILASNNTKYAYLYEVIDGAMDAGVVEYALINNYVCFEVDGVCTADELYRIVGVMDENDHGIANSNLVKVMKDTQSGIMRWDENVKNNWPTATLNTYLQNDYATSISSYKSLIQTGVTWYLGGTGEGYNTVEKASSYYANERDYSSVYAYGTDSANTFVYNTGNYGLIYSSDYGYAVLAEDCTRSSTILNYFITNCIYKNWIYAFDYPTFSTTDGYNSFQWTITHASYLNNCSYALSGVNGKIAHTSVYYNGAVRPSFYLVPEAKVLSGTGSSTDPYVVGI